MNLVQRIAGAARLLATGKLAPSTGFEGAQMQRRLMTWRAGGESVNSLILQGGELQRARARQLVRANPYAANASASFTSHAVGCGIKPSSLVVDGALKDEIQRLWLAWTDEADADGLTDFYGLQAMAARAMVEAWARGRSESREGGRACSESQRGSWRLARSGITPRCGRAAVAALAARQIRRRFPSPLRSSTGATSHRLSSRSTWRSTMRRAPDRIKCSAAMPPLTVRVKNGRCMAIQV